MSDSLEGIPSETDTLEIKGNDTGAQDAELQRHQFAEKFPEAKLNMVKAFDFLEQVRAQGNDAEMYNGFIEIMKAFKDGRSDLKTVMDSVAHLFRANPELIQGFNVFTPPGHSMPNTPGVTADVTGSDPGASHAVGSEEGR
ncbi:hypothetical protein FA15DRAFT_759219 [Coprinopsis marcescibilis]|uniref:PAH2 domain-containing protein n=1 Tax=Coprinopsis marcescibilis TaxID=230819 RepID=A0A5C3KL46_COPMA|nr:hypothetical protein FA15DRAFT_759219 [Coprinopsis marcescibilis]